ncbi:Reverse transcriptase zinc-binding domain, partial [Thalictrum thalictroides]
MEADQWIWKWGKQGRFTVSSLYDQLTKPAIGVNGQPRFISNLAWKVPIMLKVKFFIWCMLHGKVPTRDKLIQKGILITSGCPMCNQGNETIMHLFFHCAWAQELWGDVLYTLGSDAPNPAKCVSVEKWLLEWPQLHLSDFGKAVWKVVPYA